MNEYQIKEKEYSKVKKITEKFFCLIIIGVVVFTLNRIIVVQCKKINVTDQNQHTCAEKELLNCIIDEILNRQDLFESKKNEFINKLKIFREKYNV